MQRYCGMASLKRVMLKAAVWGIASLGAGCGANPPSAAKMPTKAPPNTFQTLNQTPKPMTISRLGNRVTIQLYAEETRVPIAPGVDFPAWTFDGTVPAPSISLRVGDHVTLTLHNLDPKMAHAIDLHAAQVLPGLDFTPVLPGQSKTIHFVARLPGVYLYHCEASPMPLHIAQGMYGAIVVTPPGQMPPLYTLVQSEFYDADNLNAVLNSPPNYVVFNGVADRYSAHPLPVPLKRPFTVAVVNAGPNLFSAFHVVGSILRDVHPSGNPRNNLYNLQTYTIAPGDGALIQLEFYQPGQYSFLSHAMNQFGKGAYGVFNALSSRPTTSPPSS